MKDLLLASASLDSASSSLRRIASYASQMLACQGLGAKLLDQRERGGLGSSRIRAPLLSGIGESETPGCT